MTAMDALNRARAAWERTSPQLTIDGWADALDETDVVSGRKLTSVSSSAPSEMTAAGYPSPCGAGPGSGALANPEEDSLLGGPAVPPAPSSGSEYERAGRTSFGGVRGLPDWRQV